MSTAPEVLLQPVRCVLYQDKLSTTPVPINNQPWASLVEFLSYIEESPCVRNDPNNPNRCRRKDCKFKSFSSIKGNYMAWSPTVMNGDRLDKNVVEVTALVLDFDHITDEKWAEITQKISPYENVIHTTHNHEPPLEGAYRAVLALTRPVPADQFHRFLRAAVKMLDVPADPTCKNRSRLYFRPSRPKDVIGLARANSGKLLDVDEVLAFGDTLVEPETSSTLRDFVESEWDLNHPKFDEALDIAIRWFPPYRRHEFCMALAGVFRSHGADEETAYYAVYKIAEDGGSTDPETRAGTVTHTYERDAAEPMTAITRMQQILADFLGEDDGKQIAIEFGNCLNDVNNAPLNVRKQQEPEDSPPKSFLPQAPITTNEFDVVTATGEFPAPAGMPPIPPEMLAPVTTVTPPPIFSEMPAITVQTLPPLSPEMLAAQMPPIPPAPPLVVDLAALRKQIKAIAAKKSASLSRNERIMSVLLQRLLSGSPLAEPGGVGDIETKKENEDNGITPEDAVPRVAGAIAFKIDTMIPAEGLTEIVRRSLTTIGKQPIEGGDWLSIFKSCFERSQRMRIEQETKQRKQSQTLVEQARSTLQLPLDDGKWKDKLRKKPDGDPQPTPYNIGLIFSNDPGLNRMIRWNEFEKKLEVTPVGFLSNLPTASTEKEYVTSLRAYISMSFQINADARDIEGNILLVARANSYDPLRDYLLTRKWDGVERAETLLIRYFGVADTPHSRRIARRWLVGSVARALDPGCKFDNVLVFVGLQGKKKTSAFEALGGPFYRSSEINLHDKDSKMLAGYSWLVELAELAAIRQTETTLQKSFLTQRYDFYRAPYAASLKQTPRRAVFIGTTNEPRFLTDPTGNRRWWPFMCGDVDISGLLRDRDQLWAEAVAVYLAHEFCYACSISKDTVFGQKPRCEEHRWWLSSEEEADAQTAADEFQDDAPHTVWQQKIIEWWAKLTKRPSEVNIAQIAMEVGELAIDRASHRSVTTTIGMALSGLGFRHTNRRTWVPSATFAKMPPGRGLFAIPGGLADKDKEGT